jgi:hypothetical protein
LRDRVGFLERQLETEQAASAELRRIVAGLVQRVPELEPAREAASEVRETPQTASPRTDRGTDYPDEEGAQEPAWWRRIFGFS